MLYINAFVLLRRELNQRGLIILHHQSTGQPDADGDITFMTETYHRKTQRAVEAEWTEWAVNSGGVIEITNY